MTNFKALRRLTFCVIALLVVCGALLAASDLPLPLPPLTAGFVGGKPTQVSSAIYTVTLLSLCATV